MLCIGIGFGVCVVALFKLMNSIACRQMEQDIALILSESTTIGQSLMPSKSEASINVLDRAESMPVIIEQSFKKAPA